MQLDLFFFILLVIGLIISAIGTIWLLVRAFQSSVGWGLLVLLVPLLGHLIFLISKFRKAIFPTLLMLVGSLVMASPVYNLINPPPIQDTAQEEQKQIKDATGEVKTEARITLTGAKRDEYAQLWKKDHFAVIQWANDDVTDEDAVKLEAMKQLREIDLNSTKITDKTLMLLAELKTLEVVRVANTQATAEGVEKFLLTLPNLKELDVRGLKVPSKVLREWKAKDQSNRKFAN